MAEQITPPLSEKGSLLVDAALRATPRRASAELDALVDYIRELEHDRARWEFARDRVLKEGLVARGGNMYLLVAAPRWSEVEQLLPTGLPGGRVDNLVTRAIDAGVAQSAEVR